MNISSENDSDRSNSALTTPNVSDSNVDTYLELILEGLVLADNPLDYYEDLVCVGHGGTAEVYKAVGKQDATPVAIKKFRSDVSFQDIGNELRMLRKCKHEHINSYIEGYLWENCTCCVAAVLWIVYRYPTII